MEKKKKLIHRLRSKYRLVIMNDTSFEEKVSITLTKLNVFIVLSSLLVFFAGMIFLIVSYTPLKEYIPGAGSSSDNTREFIELALRVDSLQRVLEANSMTMYNEMSILVDKPDTTAGGTPNPSDTVSDHSGLHASNQELALRKEIKPRQDFSLQKDRKLSGDILFAPFFSPMKGLVSAKFDPMIDHLATDIVSGSDQTVKATLDGTVILASWTPETGHVIAVQHDKDLVSIYKHNSVLLKKVGNFVDAGEAIAVVGNSGELSSGPHLHFELWYKGLAVNAEDYIVFK